jgi:hypothetical protein
LPLVLFLSFTPSFHSCPLNKCPLTVLAHYLIIYIPYRSKIISFYVSFWW